MIFTYMWAFDSKDDWDYIHMLEELFLSEGAEIYYVELEADYDARIKRNTTENRLLHKPTKRDVVKSEQIFRRLEDKFRLNSFDGEIQKNNYIRINNTALSPQVVAEKIKEEFLL